VPGLIKAGERLSAVLELCFVITREGKRFPSFFLHKQTVHFVYNKTNRHGR